MYMPEAGQWMRGPVGQLCFFQNYTEILSDLDILWLICRTCRHESLKAVMSCSRHVIFSHSRENDSIITVLFPDCKEYCYINMIYQNHIYGEKFMIQNYILLFFEYNLQEEKTVPRAFWTLKTAEKWLAGYAFSGAFRDDPGVDSSCRLYSKNNNI